MSKWFGHAIKLGMIEAEDPGILALTFLGAFHLRHFVHHTFGEALVKSSSRHFIKNLVDTVCRGIETKESAS